MLYWTCLNLHRGNGLNLCYKASNVAYQLKVCDAEGMSVQSHAGEMLRGGTRGSSILEAEKEKRWNRYFM